MANPEKQEKHTPEALQSLEEYQRLLKETQEDAGRLSAAATILDQKTWDRVLEMVNIKSAKLEAYRNTHPDEFPAQPADN
ncbi:MAG: hypothetical protein Q7R94_01220 [bacterium]|nr:hypothetical protein [bacterium]